MTTHQLPRRIVLVMIGTIAVFVLTLAVAVAWTTRALDDKAREDSVRLVSSAVDGLLSGTYRVTVEYSKWDEFADAAERRDMGWLYRNVGSYAASDLMNDLVVLWGGPFARDVGWLDGSAPDGTPGLVEPDILAGAGQALAEVPVGAAEGVRLFAWRGQDLFVAAAARVEWAQDLGRAEANDGRIARLLMGHRVTGADIEAVAAATLLGGLEIGRAAPRDRPAVALRGADGAPVAWLAWDAPRPGTELLGRLLPLLLGTTLLATGLAGVGIALARRNAEALVAAERRACSAARTDGMTGLPNRVAFGEALAAPAGTGRRAILFLDINDFKRINDSVGHEAGDRVIVHVAERLGALAGPGCLLARIAGDEFVFVVTGLDAETRTRRLAAAATAALAEPFGVLGHRMQVGLAMGYAVQAVDDMTGHDLVRQADLAMYEAKRHKEEGRLVAYSAVIAQASRDAQAIEQELRRALGQFGGLGLAYQPIVDAGGRLARAEALARWTSPRLGAVAPDRFIPVAERAGLIVELGLQLFRLVCRDLAAHPDLEVSVNISTLQLMAPDFVPSLLRELEAGRLDPRRVEIELTEAVLVDDARLAARRIEELRAAGFSIALDDFGTGYSSVGYLEQLCFDTLKIDRSFVAKVRDAGSGIAVVDGMIRMAHGLGLRVVCEGVETAEDLDLLRELGADMAQGFHLDRPLPIDALAARWLGRAAPRAAVA